jgi:hypothetical protein
MSRSRFVAPTAADDASAGRERSCRAIILAATLVGGLTAVLALATRAGAGDRPPSLRDGQITPEAKAFWSFQPLGNPPVPAVDDPAWSGSEIDRFLRARQQSAGVVPAGVTDKRTLIRRVTFDLTGLPPAPEDVDAFLADAAPGAYAKVLERLLASPHCGERWGRHWLDVVRYADTAGETADFPVPHAWRYRNYVIDAFNADKPYDQFLREQLAGDLLAQQLPPDAPRYRERFAELVTATGYITVARRFGYDSRADHHLTIEDTIDTLGKSVLGLTVACARCHDHKYDPIPAADFYALFGIFESTRYPYPGAEIEKVPKDMVPLMPVPEIERVMAPHREAMTALDAAVAKAAADRAAAEGGVRQALEQARAVLAAGDVPNGGSQDVVCTATAPTEVKVGQMIHLAILPKGDYGADSTMLELEIAEVGGQSRTWSLARDLVPDLHGGEAKQGNPHADTYGNPGVWYFLDVRGTPAAAPTFLSQPTTGADATAGVKAWRGAEETPVVGANPTDAAMKPITATIPPKSIFAHPSPAGGVAVAWVSPIDGAVKVAGKVTDIDPGGGDGVAWSLEHIHAADVGPALIKTRNLAAAHDDAVKRRAAQAAAEPRFPMAYAVAEGQPHDSPVHLRGDPKTPGPVVPRRFLQALGGHSLPSESASKASGRLELAQWLTDPASPAGALAARVMVNRVWQHHFGRGLVATPNDFGTRGEPPSHPELLEYLARRFVEDGWSVKSLHRIIVLSHAYQLASDEREDTARIDAGNALLSHFTRRRLSAEEIRDNILLVTGDLDRTRGEGHPFPAENTWGFTQHTPFSAVYETDKRSVYLMTQRLKRHPLLALFDGPDPNASTPQRFTTTVAPQSLFFINDPWVHAKAEKMAGRLIGAHPDDATRLNRAYRLMFSRAPTPTEHQSAAEFLTAYRGDLEQAGVAAEQRDAAAWAAYVRVLLGTNEFVYVD